MEKIGWVKFYRKEILWLSEMSEREFVLYLCARASVVWDKRSKHFGTFDGRIKIIKQDIVPQWSVGTISEVRNLLLNRGAFQRTDDPRAFRVTNSEMFLRHGKKIDSLIQFSEENLHVVDKKLQPPEKITVNNFNNTAIMSIYKRINSKKTSGI